MTVSVLYGTELGNTEMVAEDVADALHGAEVKSLADVAPSDLACDQLYLVLCSSYGDGELPNTAVSFAEGLEGGARLEGVRFAMFGLGDTNYDTFGEGPKTLRRLMVAAGAVEVSELLIHDANGPRSAEEDAIAWAEKLVDENSRTPAG